jgi:hypothetical protein
MTRPDLEHHAPQESLSARITYLIECHRSGHEELMFRVSHRDQWLKLQLLAQATFLALALGVEVGGVKATNPFPTVIVVALPIAITLTALYVVEDRLIGLISRYVGRLSRLEAELSSSTTKIDYVGSSSELREYIRTTLPIRALAQCVVFGLIPTGLATYRMLTVSSWTPIRYVEAAVDAACLIGVGILLAISFSDRRKWARGEDSPGFPQSS